MIRQPIAMATDSRGRLWVAENNTYAERTLNFDLSQFDRIHILEDADHDGRAEKHVVFWDRGQRLTSVEIGFGGVWALCPPQLLFIPDRNGDDIPDGPPEVVLDGWDDGAVRHNIANGLRFGPDGWLYGRHGIQATSLVGAPGTPKDQRVSLNCSIWRYHPTRKLFEVVCRGGTNSWGADWDAYGELFYINTVIGHLWHAVPGAYTQRMYGEHDNPHLYTLLDQVADHFHWDTAEAWDKIRGGVSPTTAQAGGGHAHSGFMIYQGDNWPARYRGTLFTVNLHGRRLNNDLLERDGAGYRGRHAADFLKSTDEWFRALDLISGADGGVYLADWSDIGECHENDGVHRSSGRIYKITYGTPTPSRIDDLSRLDDARLVALLGHPNDWFSRQALHRLHERAAAGRPMNDVHKALRSLFESDADSVVVLRALWGLHVTGGAPDDWLLRQLQHKDEHVRVWALRLLGDGKVPSSETIRAMTSLAGEERSGLVLLYLASALQAIPLAERWELAERIAAHGEFASDPMLPLMIWYGLEAAVPDDPARAVRLAWSSRMLVVSRMIARRLTENLERVPGPVDALVAESIKSDSNEQRLAVLQGMTEALRGWRKAPAPASWKQVKPVMDSSAMEGIRTLSRELSVVFGDGRASDDLLRIASAKNGDLAARRDAIRVLVEARERKVQPLLRGALGDRDLGPDAARGLAAFEDPDIPPLLIARFAGMRPQARAEAIVTLASRPASAQALLKAVDSGAIDRGDVSAFQVRQMLEFPDVTVQQQVAKLWPQTRAIAGAKRERIDGLKAQLGPSILAEADLSRGRLLYARACSTCHTLFGQGGKIGPDLTGAQRQSLEYLLENVVDPAATVAADYTMSTVSLTDGRLLSGIVGNRNGPTLTVQTPTDRLVVSRSDVEAIKGSELSLMPERLLDTLNPQETRDLVAYLMSPQQVPLAAEAPEQSKPGK